MPDDSVESTYVKDKGEWNWVKKNGRWQPQLLPESRLFSPERDREIEQRTSDFVALVRETDEQWKESDAGHKNEGFLRDHPRYRGLYLKWALRYLRHRGFDKRKYIDKIDDTEGQLLRTNGRHSGYWLLNETANGREWIDDFVKCELRTSEGFVDITHDYERREELGVEPENSGWWTLDEI